MGFFYSHFSIFRQQIAAESLYVHNLALVRLPMYKFIGATRLNLQPFSPRATITDGNAFSVYRKKVGGLHFIAVGS